MIKPFVALAFVLTLMILAVGLHFTLFPCAQNIEKLQQFTSFTQISTPSLSIQYDTSKFNTAYPDMPTLGRMDFVYEQ